MKNMEVMGFLVLHIGISHGIGISCDISLVHGIGIGATLQNVCLLA